MNGQRLAALAAVLCVLPLSLAGGAPDERAAAYGRATARLGRTLVLVAARGGPDAARRLAGPHLPARVGEGLEQAARSPAASDLRATGAGQLDLQGMLVPRVIADVAGLSSSLAELAALGGARLSQELTQLEGECRRLQGAAATLERSAKAGSVPSRITAEGLDAGRELLALARGAALLQDDLTRTGGQLPRYELLSRILGRTPDPWVRFLLDLAPRAAESARAELRAAGDRAGEVQALVRQVELRLGGAVEALEDALARAVAAVTRIRQEELNRSLAGSRGSEMSQALLLLQGYKSQFGEPPDLEALPAWDVYADRRSGRLHFWLAGEGRWERGPERVDPLGPAQAALLGARSPALRTLAAEPRALARLLVAFEGPFQEGLAALSAAAEGVVAGAERIEGLGRAHGFEAGEVAAALEGRVGASLRLLGPAEERLAVLRERALEAAVWRGPQASRDLLRGLEAAARELAELEVQATTVALEGPGGALGEGVQVDLLWTPDPATTPEAWLLTPPASTRADRISVLRVARAGGRDVAGAASVRAFALRGEQVLGGEAGLAGEGSALRLAPLPAPALVARPDAQGRLLVHQLPRASEPLWVWRATPAPARPLRPLAGPAAEGAPPGWAWWVELGPQDDPGRWTLAGRDAQGAERARLEVEVGAEARVRLTSPAGPRALPAGETCQAELVGGAEAEAREWTISSEAGVPLARARGETLQWGAELPPGRYLVATPGAAPAPLAIAPRGSTGTEARVELTCDPWLAGGVAAVHTGQGAFLRLAAWPAVAPEELLQVEWVVQGGAREVHAVTRPVPGAPWAAALLPLRIARDARPGERKVLARAHTLRGVLEVEGSFRVAPGAAAPLALELLDARGERVGSQVAARPEHPGRGLRPEAAVAVALGGPEGLLRVARELSNPSWVLVGPRGTVRSLVPRWDGAVPLALAAGDPPGEHQVWLSASTPAGQTVHGRLLLLAYRARPLEVRSPPAPSAGQKLRLEALPPLGYRAPFQVRVGHGAWTQGTALEVVTQVENAFQVELRDADDRRASGEVAFRAPQAPGAESALRFGIAADVRERRVFAVDHALLQSYKRSQNLPPTWVVLEPGPLSAGAVRDRLWQTVPFDGPSDPTDAQLAYRSVRFWEGLQESARARFAALDAPTGVPYAVQNSPAPGGETTLRDLSAKHLSERGGWAYRLARVELAAEGADPDPSPPRKPDELVRFRPWSAGGQGGGLSRVTVAAPVGRLFVRPVLPPTITLGREARLLVTCAAERQPLLPGRSYPAGWEQLLPRAVLLLELTATLRMDGEELTTVVRRADPGQVGIDLGVVLAALGAERAGSGADAPRVAERVAVRVGPLHQAPQEQLRRLLPAPPGQLDPTPRELVLEVAVRLVPAVLARDWPEGRPRPDALFVDAVPHLPDPGDLPKARVVFTATWLRASGEAEPEPAPPPLGDQVAAAEAVAEEEPKALLQRVEGAWPPPDDRREEVSRALRRVLQRAPEEPRAWALLADLARLEGRTLEAQNLARWALAAGPSPLARVVELEALLANFRLEEARRALNELAKTELSAPLQRRVEAARRALR